MPTEAAVRQFKMELARREFFYYAHIRANDFYTLDRSYLESLCNEIQEFIETDTERALIINAPPRHGKSRTAQLAVECALGKTKSLKIMTGSYNEMLATQFSKGVRNAIQEEKADESRIVYSDVFPDVRIKRGDAAMNLWSLEGGYNNYLATSPTGTATGFGADLLIIDDLIKNSMEANTARVLEGHWSWFTNTMLSRLEANGKIIIIMTRWHSKDLAGRALTELPEMGYSVRHISYKALQEDGTMLCDEILPLDEYQAKSKVMDPAVASANYQQEPIDLRGRLYDHFKTYEELPMDGAGNLLFTGVKLYCDTADTGEDYLCSIVYGEYEKEAYVLDVVYTRAPMEETEPAVASQCIEHEVNIADIESNNGGRGFSRAVMRQLQEKGWNRTKVRWFHQSKNKVARIMTQATFVMDHIYFPVNWRDRWPEFYQSMYEYQREGKNAHDDAQDAITGVAEHVQKNVNIALHRHSL